MRDQNPQADDHKEANCTDEASFLRTLLKSLEAEDSAAFDELMMSNSQLADEYYRAGSQVAFLRDALTAVGTEMVGTEIGTANDAGAGVSQDSRFAAIVAQTKDRLAVRKKAQPGLALAGSESNAEEPAGILTDVTRQLSVDQARQLFEKLTPMLVYTTLKHLGLKHLGLKHLDRNCLLEEVDRVVCHLCSEDTQVRLRTAEHVRDALVGELSMALELNGLHDQLDRAQMTRLLEDSGAMVDLVAMANCITLAKTQAG